MTLFDLAGHFYDNPEAHFYFADHGHDGFRTTLHVATTVLELGPATVAWWKVDREKLHVTLLDCPANFAELYDRTFSC